MVGLAEYIVVVVGLVLVLVLVGRLLYRGVQSDHHQAARTRNQSDHQSDQSDQGYFVRR